MPTLEGTIDRAYTQNSNGKTCVRDYIITGVSNLKDIYSTSGVPAYGSKCDIDQDLIATNFSTEVKPCATGATTVAKLYTVVLTVTFTPPSGRIVYNPNQQIVSWQSATFTQKVDTDIRGNLIGSPHLWSTNEYALRALEGIDYSLYSNQTGVFNPTDSNYYYTPIPGGEDTDAELGTDILMANLSCTVVMPVAQSNGYNPVTMAGYVGKTNVDYVTIDGFNFPPRSVIMVSAETEVVGTGFPIPRRTTFRFIVGTSKLPTPSYTPFFRQQLNANRQWVNWTGAAGFSDVNILPIGYSYYPIYSPHTKVGTSYPVPYIVDKTLVLGQIPPAVPYKSYSLDKSKVQLKRLLAVVVFEKYPVAAFSTLGIR